MTSVHPSASQREQRQRSRGEGAVRARTPIRFVLLAIVIRYDSLDEEGDGIARTGL